MDSATGRGAMEAYRQGDVLIVRIDDEDRQQYAWGSPMRREPGEGLVLAEGEATGHTHRVMNTRARLTRHSNIRVNGRKTTHVCLSVPPQGAVVEHEEHASIALAHGKYLVMRQSEYTPPSETRERAQASRARNRTYVAD